ncbi:unnamed protein product [Arctia plantaginis]|uniref:PCI domain-containing protein n=1 Tax=Arctia plantaginis TaxID=874455 RepID=A0A8S0YMJ5_ARCPL|nr:unnamed protein product [Arctia plantaginis]
MDTEPEPNPTSPRKKVKSPSQDVPVNPRTCITCTNVPDCLFDATAAGKHFSKFGRVQKIRLAPKKHLCIIEFEHPSSVERALLNAGAYDGFMFDVTRTKLRARRRSTRKEDDPDWVPDPEVEQELSAMGGTPTYRFTRARNSMDVEKSSLVVSSPRMKALQQTLKQPPVKKKLPVREKKSVVQPAGLIEPPVAVTTTQTNLSTLEAATELHQLRSKISLTPDEQWRILDARDRVLRAWGGAGSRVKVGGATIGTCQDMCPEKELLQRQSEHQVMTLESVPESDGELDTWRAVKQYSRSSADQEIPMCYELRPPQVLLRTCAYLLHEIADTKRQVSLADWFHFMWDRFRGIRKDITQQALCCADSISLVEMCARFHAHCAARLADLEHTQFDQKLNTDNLTKCLQTLKHMYADVSPEAKPREAEFRGYVALLNLGDANFWWEIKQLPEAIQKSAPIAFAINVFNALDNNNYVRFFRLIKHEATYLQACILLRYFNDVRARALARIVKAYAPRGGSRYPAEDMIRTLAFESIENLKSFINHYGLRFSRTDDSEICVILDRNQFIEDSDPYPISRAIDLVESKKNCSVGEIIAGGFLPDISYSQHILYTSFTPDGRLKETALTAEDQGYNTINDSNKDINALKTEIQRLSQGVKSYGTERPADSKANVFVKHEPKSSSSKPAHNFATPVDTKLFSFKPAIPVAPTDIIKNSPEKIFSSDKNMFSFSKPQETAVVNSIFSGTETVKSLFDTKPNVTTNNIFSKQEVDKGQSSQSLFGGTKSDVNKPKSTNVFGDVAKSVFNSNDQKSSVNQTVFGGNNIFTKNVQKTAEKQTVFGSKNIFTAKEDNSTEKQAPFSSNNIFASANNNLFVKPDSTITVEKGGNIFQKPTDTGDNETKNPSKIFGAFGKLPETSNIFSKSENEKTQNFANGETSKSVSPGSLFKSVLKAPNGSDDKTYSIFQSKNKAQTVADNILNSIPTTGSSIYEFNQNNNEAQNLPNSSLLENQRLLEERVKAEERKLQEAIKKQDEIRKQEQKRQEEERRKEEERKRQEETRKKQEEIKLLEEKRKREEQKKQEELKRKLEEQKKAELKRKAEEEQKFKERVNKESSELVEELINEVKNETVKDMVSEELKKLKNLMDFAAITSDEIVSDLCVDICKSEMKAETFLTQKIRKKWFHIWKKNHLRNIKRRSLLNDTPVWLTQKTPVEEAALLRRIVENSALCNMYAIHRGYRFTGEVKQLPKSKPYNIMEIIRSPLLKRMKQISYPYDKCFFWKLSLIVPGSMKYLYRKINIENWLIDAFGDKKKHDVSDTLIHVSKQSWNHLMDFAISVSLISKDKPSDFTEAVDGANGLLFYATENDNDLVEVIQETLKSKYPYQVIPVAVIIPIMESDSLQTRVETLLADLVKRNVIIAYRLFVISSKSVSETLDMTTKTAMKWLARKYPLIPPLETDYLKSLCQRYLGNEIWCKLKSHTHNRMNLILKDLYKLIKCYNTAVDKLTDVITNEDLFNYSTFPLEFQPYLDSASPYPKPYEFIPSSARTSDNVSAIKRIMNHLKLPDPKSDFNPVNAISMQNQITDYCNQIGWFDDPAEVVCKVVAILPHELSNVSMPNEDFKQYYAHYNLLDFMNIVVYEKINRLNNFENRFAIYDKCVLQDYRSALWLHEVTAINELKHKAFDYEDGIDSYIESKRRKLAMTSLECLMLEDKDRTLVEEQIKETDENISKYNNCAEAVNQLEQLLEKEKNKSLQFEKFLETALGDW